MSYEIPCPDIDRPTLRVRLVRPDAQPPTYATDGAAGLDLYASWPRGAGGGRWRIPRTGSLAIPTGVAVALPPGHEGQVRPRSGLALRDGVTAVLGTIDSDYRGEVMVLLRNDGREGYTVRRGDRIAQLVVAPVTRVQVDVVEEISDTARGEGGFGSTGR